MAMRRLFLSLLPLLLMQFAVTSAAAQSPYVGASILADIVRLSGPVGQQFGNGEALGGALQLGTPIGEHLGVEVAFTRSADIESRPDFTILADVTRAVPNLINVLPEIAIFPIPNIAQRSQLSTLTTVLWWRQKVNDRLDLVYLGGAAFTRRKDETRVEYRLNLPIAPGVLPPTRISAQETVAYDTGLVVGLEGNVKMTDHLRIVPGLRMLTVTSRWIIRPSAGLQWRF
jgi:hypothetical protein